MSGESRTILVTGASRGIGRATCDRLTAAGHRVVEWSRKDGVDLAELDAIPGRVAELLSATPELDGVVASAAAPTFGHLEELAPREIAASIELNLTSPIVLVRALLPHFKRAGRGDVVLIGSESGKRGGKRGSIYSAAKFGLRGFAEAIRAESAGAGVRVGVVHPGAVRTSWFDSLDFAPGDGADEALEADDVARVVEQMITARPGVVIDEIDLSPQKRVFRPRPK